MKKQIKSIIMGSPTIETLLIMARSLHETFVSVSKEYENLPENVAAIKDQMKYMGAVMFMGILLPFICELGLTVLYLLDHSEIKKIPREHSLLYWWKNLKGDTKQKITNKFEEIKRQESEIKEEETPDKILKWNDKAHVEWRYWWRKGFATGSPSSMAMRHLTIIILEIGWSYPQSQRNRKLIEGIEGHKEYAQARKKRGMN